MSDPAGPPRPGGLPPPRSRPWAGLPWIWAVPVIALVIAAWLGLRTISDRGPIITISFANAEGIELGRNEAARTTIRYKNVELGRVASLGLSDDKSNVVVTAEMRREGICEEFVETVQTGWWTTCLEALPAKERAAGRF